LVRRSIIVVCFGSKKRGKCQGACSVSVFSWQGAISLLVVPGPVSVAAPLDKVLFREHLSVPETNLGPGFLALIPDLSGLVVSPLSANYFRIAAIIAREGTLLTEWAA